MITGIQASRPSPAIVVAVLALVAAFAGTAVAEEATTSAKPVTKKKAKKIANKEIDKRFPIGGDDFFLNVVQDHNFGLVDASNCTWQPGQSPTLPISTPGITATDHVLVTPPPGFADTFTLTGVPDPANNRVVVSACNNFFAGSGDPDGGGGPYKLLVIR